MIAEVAFAENHFFVVEGSVYDRPRTPESA